VTRSVVATAGAAALWCAVVIVTTLVHSGPPMASVAIYVPAVLVLPVVLHTIWRARKDALLALALVPKSLLVLAFPAVVAGWMFSFGALHGLPGHERLSSFAGLVLVLHAAFGLISAGLLKVDANPHLR
jgi:hypothetical protein